MKKIIALLLALMMACMMLPALAEEVTGDWYGILFGMPVQLVLNADNTYSLIIAGESAGDGTWALKDGVVMMDEDEDPANGFAFDGETLTNEANAVTFTRNAEDIVVITVGAPAAAALEDYAGEWVCRYFEVNGQVVDIEQAKDMMGMNNLPAMVIEGSSMRVTEIGLEALTDSDTLEMEYKDGALVYELSLGDSPFLTVTVQMLDDGLANLCMQVGDDAMNLYFVPAAAAETPAA